MNVTTERYDNQQLERLQVGAGKLESGKLFAPTARESGTEFHISCTTGPTIEAAGSLARATTSITCCRVRRLKVGWVLRTEFASGCLTAA